MACTYGIGMTKLLLNTGGFQFFTLMDKAKVSISQYPHYCVQMCNDTPMITSQNWNYQIERQESPQFLTSRRLCGYTIHTHTHTHIHTNTLYKYTCTLSLYIYTHTMYIHTVYECPSPHVSTNTGSCQSFKFLSVGEVKDVVSFATTFILHLFIFGSAGSLLPCRLFSCGEQGLLSSCDAWACHCSGFPVAEHGLKGLHASAVAVGELSSCSSWALEHRLNGCGARAQLLLGGWNLLGSGIKYVSPALAGGFLTTGPPGKPTQHSLNVLNQYES